MRLLALAMVLAITACVVEHTPDTPSNAAIQLTQAIRAEDEAGAALVCSEISGSEDYVFLRGETWGLLTEFHEARIAAMAQGNSAFGGASEYPLSEEADLEVDSAWTEIEFGEGSSAETWRLHMVREDQWTVCDAEKMG